MVLGAQVYEPEELQKLLRLAAWKDASIRLARQLTAAKLNCSNGLDCSAIAVTIANADKLLGRFEGELPFEVIPFGKVGQRMLRLAERLERFNLGQALQQLAESD